ncbi:DUF421 domain-containing protein [Sporosarcina thermotolerans]|uniref:DUF421 domain-containing protein n=1 Tax=Sporosarcina thermotolerans TaxID=633404 RepID=A0AAW9A5E5_9BACL|nr:DUF421 domain-containing protein [Sporosarcina thermotolerans]MDW0115365.1 DUF421 domain-containing protein [Sporosarcina thermotolerans]WHT47292.1 DUF421 domain-containing protein [Sporosarcina thermotolerans]
MDYLIIGSKLIVGLIALMVVIRLLGKKHLAEMTPYDIIYLIIFGGILEESIYDSEVSIWMFLFSLAVWAASIYFIEKLVARCNPLRILLKGEPDQLIDDGKVNIKAFKRNQLEMEQVRTMLRQQGVFSLREVRDMYIEPGGQISINSFAKYKSVTAGDLELEKEEEAPSVLLVDEGEVKREVLNAIGKSEQWLREGLIDEGFDEIEKILYCEWSKADGFFIRSYADTINTNKHKPS